MFAVVVSTFARRLKRDRRSCCRGCTAKERNRGNDECSSPRHCAVHIILSLPCGEEKTQNPAYVKYWEIIADNLSKAGWSLGYVSAVDSMGRTIWIADAHRDDGKRFVARADEKLTAFIELESAIRAVSP
jgi:hypothetical protein